MARTRRKGKPITGWLCLDKPRGMTSTAAVGFVRRVTGAAKAGHGGTLDPLATGVLPIALGEATKTVAYVIEGKKHYRFTIRLGESRTTDDAEGETVAISRLRPENERIEALLPEFVGAIDQTPPRFAAVKINGERAYDLARRGEPVELPPRTIQIDSLRLIERPDADHVTFDLVCGRGTYVRSLARDLGERLGCHAHVANLQRRRTGGFDIADAVSPETLSRLVADDAIFQAIVPMGTVLKGMPALALTGPQATRLRAGQTITIAPDLVVGESGADRTICAMAAGEVVALARLEGGELSPVRVFNP